MARPVHPGLFREDPPALLASRCDACGRPAFPRADLCPYCGADTVTEITLSSTGTLWAWTTVLAAPPGYSGEVPYGFGIVELPEGLRVVTRLAAPVDGYTFGQPMRLRIVALERAERPGHDDGEAASEPLLTWEFAP